VPSPDWPLILEQIEYAGGFIANPLPTTLEFDEAAVFRGIYGENPVTLDFRLGVVHIYQDDLDAWLPRIFGVTLPGEEAFCECFESSDPTHFPTTSYRLRVSGKGVMKVQYLHEGVWADSVNPPDLSGWTFDSLILTLIEGTVQVGGPYQVDVIEALLPSDLVPQGGDVQLDGVSLGVPALADTGKVITLRWDEVPIRSSSNRVLQGTITIPPGWLAAIDPSTHQEFAFCELIAGGNALMTRSFTGLPIAEAADAAITLAQVLDGHFEGVAAQVVDYLTEHIDAFEISYPVETDLVVIGKVLNVGTPT